MGNKAKKRRLGVPGMEQIQMLGASLARSHGLAWDSWASGDAGEGKKVEDLVKAAAQPARLPKQSAAVIASDAAGTSSASSLETSDPRGWKWAVSTFGSETISSVVNEMPIAGLSARALRGLVCEGVRTAMVSVAVVDKAPEWLARHCYARVLDGLTALGAAVNENNAEVKRSRAEGNENGARIRTSAERMSRLTAVLHTFRRHCDRVGHCGGSDALRVERMTALHDVYYELAYDEAYNEPPHSPDASQALLDPPHVFLPAVERTLYAADSNISDRARAILRAMHCADAKTARAWRKAWDARRAWFTEAPKSRGKSGKREKGGGEEDSLTPWLRYRSTHPLLRVQRAIWTLSVAILFRPGSSSLSLPPISLSLSSLDAWRASTRDWAARFYAYATPSQSALDTLCNLPKPIVEIAAGNGYWAAMANQRAREREGEAERKRDRDEDEGEDEERERESLVIATDRCPPQFSGVENEYHGRARRWTRVLKLSAIEAISSLSPETLVVCYPPPGVRTAAEGALAEFKGSRVVYIGEWGSGMTATREFHRILGERGGEWEIERVERLPNWPETAATMSVWRRRSEAERERDPEDGGDNVSDAELLDRCRQCGQPARRRCTAARELLWCGRPECLSLLCGTTTTPAATASGDCTTANESGGDAQTPHTGTGDDTKETPESGGRKDSRRDIGGVRRAALLGVLVMTPPEQVGWVDSSWRKKHPGTR